MKHFNTINEGAEILGKANTPQWVEILIEKLKVAFCEEMQAWYGYIIIRFMRNVKIYFAICEFIPICTKISILY